MMKNNIIFLTNFDLSNDKSAAYARILQYAKGLTYQRSDVFVYLMSIKYFDASLLRAIIPNFVYISVPKSVSRETPYSKYCKYQNRLSNLKKIISFFEREDCNTTYIVYPFLNTWYEEKKCIKLIKQHGCRIFSERNERAFWLILNRQYSVSLWKKILLFSIYPLELFNGYMLDRMVKYYDGNIVISKNFEKWIKRINENYIRIPVLSEPIDPDPIDLESADPVFKIAYTGTLSYNKDGIDILIKAMYYLVNICGIDNVLLNLYGHASSYTLKSIQQLINKYDLERFVFLRERVGKGEISIIQKKHDCLIVVRKRNHQNKFNFSTKLAEYMYAASLVIATDISDNVHYVKHGVNAFISDPDEISIANTILYCMKLPLNEKMDIRRSAYETAVEYFNIYNYSGLMQQFILQNEER